MITLTRHVNERIVIQVDGLPPLTVAITGMSSDSSYKLSFDGPHDYRILREEVLYAEKHDITTREAKTRLLKLRQMGVNWIRIMAKSLPIRGK